MSKTRIVAFVNSNDSGVAVIEKEINLRVGVICGDIYHPADVVMQGLNNLATVQAGDIGLEVIPDTVNWAAGQLPGYAAMILTKGNSKSVDDLSSWLTEAVQQEFADYVEQGGGLLVIHAGTVGYNSQPCFRHLVGGAFRHHPKPGPVVVEVTGTSALPDVAPQSFTVHDEHYLMEMFHDDMALFMTSSQEETQPAGWTRQQGQGRVCVLTPGHYSEVWLHPNYQRIIDSALRWCAGIE